MINFFGPTRLAIVVEDLRIKYGLIDFGESLFFEAADAEALAPPQDFAPRLTSAPEVSSMTPYDPFAADVYMTGMMFLEHFYVSRRSRLRNESLTRTLKGPDGVHSRVPPPSPVHDAHRAQRSHHHGRSAQPLRSIARRLAQRSGPLSG